ncbi:MAG: hypothetical protein ONB05_06370, partial [candidate division KSB1 bacterium]|nr:hypothetical protein [candidate division KSB1 bacterium]
MSFWNITGRGTSIGVSGQGTGAVVDLSGVGTWLYFFSRVHHNWFLELNLGAVAGVRLQKSTFGDGNVEASGIIPVLFGVRYELFSPRLSGAFQPYLTLGGGPYWTTSVFTQNSWEEEEEEIVRSGLKYGAYLGGGMNIM